MSFNFPIPINFIVIPAITIATAVIGSKYAKRGAGSQWYRKLPKPKWAPQGSTIGEIWIFLYILTTLTFMWYWNVPVFSKVHYVIGAVMLFNAYLNAHWNKLFFVQHNVAKAYKEMKWLNATSIIVTIAMIFQAPIAALGMLPYIIWVGIATKITREILDNQKSQK